MTSVSVLLLLLFSIINVIFVALAFTVTTSTTTGRRQHHCHYQNHQGRLYTMNPQRPAVAKQDVPPNENTHDDTATTASTASTATSTTTATINNSHNHTKPEATVKIIVYGIRHGRSMSNEWMTGDNEWGNPTFNDRNNIRDSPLSEHGIRQAQLLCQQFFQEISALTMKNDSNNKNPKCSDHWLCHVDMILVSPLTRCLQTYQYAIEPLLPMVASFKSFPRPYVNPLLSERLYSRSEMGRSVLELQTEFPQMDWSFFDISEDKTIGQSNNIWWYDPTVPTPFNTNVDDNNCKTVSDSHTTTSEELTNEWRPYGDGQFYTCPGEPELIFQRRMEALRLWIYQKILAEIQQPDKAKEEPITMNVLTIGHWGVYRYFTNGMEMENCQICTFEL